MSYAVDHAGAAADVLDAGASVTFTKTVVSPDPTTGVPTSTTSTVTGSALGVKGDPNQYQGLGLVESEAPTLLFVPTTYGSTPSLGASCSWGGQTRVVRAVTPLAPDGTTILARVVVQ